MYFKGLMANSGGHILKKPLTEKSYKLLMSITSRYSLFDKHDNCFQASNRQISQRLHLKSKTTVDRLMQTLERKGLTSKVIDIQGITRTMLNPHFYWAWQPLEKPFALAMFQLGSNEAAASWVKDCIAVGHYIHPLTGELLKPYPFVEMNEYRNSYTSVDRTKCRINQAPSAKSFELSEFNDIKTDALGICPLAA